MRVAAALLLGAASLMAAQTSGVSQSPDQIFLHGNIYTGAEEGFGGAPARVFPRAPPTRPTHLRRPAPGAP